MGGLEGGTMALLWRFRWAIFTGSAQREGIFRTIFGPTCEVVVFFTVFTVFDICPLENILQGGDG